ncbi:MAG: restriction endonuclease subunit S [Bacteroidales bacterium]|nr:restriction endonuclease subunit S [Bacteroidales bacterium]
MKYGNLTILAGYKLSPLGIIPEDWEVKRLGEIGDFSKGNGVPKDKIIKDEHGHPCLTYGDLYTKYDFVIKDIKSFIDDDVASESKEIHIGDICFAGSGETPEDIGKCATYIEDRTAYAGGDIIIFSPNKDINSIWLSYILNSDIGGKQRYKSAQGFSIVHIYPDNLKRIQIPIPTLKEQHRIVSVLSLWDTAIAKQSALIEHLTLRKRGLMQQLLTGKKRLKGFEGEWKEVRLGEIGVFFKGEGVPKDKITDTGNKCLTYGDLYTKYDFVISNVKSYIDDDTANESVKIQYGDICFAGSGETKEDIGKCAAFIDNEFGYAGGDIIVFRANDCNPITLSYILNSSDVIRQKSNMGQGHSVVHIYPYQLEKLVINLPSRAEQDAIATILIDSDKEIEIQKQKLAAMQEQKKGLMQVLLTGKKRLK